MQTLEFCEEIKNYKNALLRKLKVENKSKNTIETYDRTYKSFIEFCKEHDKPLSFENIKEDDIYAFIDYKSATMDKQGEVSLSTRNGIIVHLKRLFTYIERNGSGLYDFAKVFEDIKLKQPKSKPKGLSDSDVDKLEKYLSKVDLIKDFVSCRNVLLVKILLYGGLRATEAVSISIKDIVSANDSLYKLVFTGKGDKNRVTYIKKELIEYELHLLNKKYQIDTTRPIALTSNGNKMCRIQLSKMVNSIYKKAKIDASGVHILRHTAAKRLIQKGTSIVTVQSILGHSSIQTTAIYANPTEDMIMRELG